MQNRRIGGTSRLLRQMRAQLEQMRDVYTGLRERENLLPWEQWLSDNFYALEAHAKQALSDLRGSQRDSAPLVAIYQVLKNVFADAAVPFEEQNVQTALSAANSIQELSERQLDFVYCALKCTLLTAAASACVDAHIPNERERLISYAVMGLSAIYEMDFDRLTRCTSAVERVLLNDPAGVYPQMTEQSRQHYRRMAARIAKWSGVVESAVARDVLACAQSAKKERERHVGFYLLRHDPQAVQARRVGVAALIITWVAPAVLSVFMALYGAGIWIALLCYLPLMEIMRVIVCGAAMRRVPVGHIPRMKLGRQVPKTVIAISTLLPDATKAQNLRARLEHLYFSNSDDNLMFCVLADFKEDKRPYNPQDDLNIAACTSVIAKLNEQYGERFMLFVRKRCYNKTQNTYSGWERKRGAITEFIRFIKGGETSMRSFVGNRSTLQNVRYLIALDSDTNLSFSTANLLVSAAMHPLNRPVIGKHNIVTEGYGILVPRMETDLASSKSTDFTRLMAGAGGVSTYEQECCDFYQDLFGEAIFAGKGLIDIDVFHTVVGRRFPENTVLSHDILEGAYLRVGLLSDVEMTDGIPTNALSWFARLHRWLRGDWQNLPFLRKSIMLNGLRRPNPISLLSRYKLFDNLRRSLIPVLSMLCVFVACFVRPGVSLLLCLIAFLSVSVGPLASALRSLAAGGNFALTRRFFARTLPRVFELLGQALFSFVMTAQQAVVTLDAVGRTLWRVFVSKKNLLQWTTAAQGETRQTGFFAVLRRSWISELAGLLLLIFAPTGHMGVKFCGALFLLYAPLATATSRVVPETRNAPTRAQREKLLSWCAQMFAFYEDQANAENHYLPPDNIQFSPHDAVAYRTSPTNIGMMLLSMLVARDFHFLDSAGLCLRIGRTLDTIDTLETYYGNLYNWYDTRTLKVLDDRFVSTVDSGNYLCALVALKEGLYEYAPQHPPLYEMIRRVEHILRNTDLSIFYNRERKLFSVGIGGDGKRSTSYYDFLMSEARTTGYYAIATRQVQYKHWRALSRTMSRSGVYAGPVSWTGTMFEYFMPHLLLPVYEGSLISEALHYALYCQKRRAHLAGVPWGISESGYFAFDEHLNYQYKAHGVQKLGVKQGLDRECVVSPYSTFLTLAFDTDAAMKNLIRLEEMGMVGRYGFYEAIDFTPSRTHGREGGAVVRSFMAHHLGMSLIACANAISDNIMQKRFMRDHSMRAAQEFLQEKISKDTLVYDDIKQQREACPAESAQLVADVEPSPIAPACAILWGGGLTHLFTGVGANWLRFSDTDVTRRPGDLLEDGQGVLALARMNGETLCATRAPFYRSDVAYGCTFTSNGVRYTAQKASMRLHQQFVIDAALGVEACTLTVYNDTPNKAAAQLFFYLEPILANNREYAVHPAFSKLFVMGERDTGTDTITFWRKHRDASTGVFLTVGFLEQHKYAYSMRRENITPCPRGLSALENFEALPLDGAGATPDACCALRLTEVVPPHGETSVTLLLCAAKTLEESVGHLITARTRALQPAFSPIMNDTMTGRLGQNLLGRLLFGSPVCEQSVQARMENTRAQDALWSLGVSGDLAIVVYPWENQPDEACLRSYTELWELMRLHQLPFDLCVLAESDLPGPIPEGVRVLDPRVLDKATHTALLAAACHIAGTAEPPAPSNWQPESVLGVLPAAIPQVQGRFDVVGGAYASGRFYVDRVTPLPFSHILANERFGTLVGDTALGCSWWYNARECRLTPWENDIATGNRGERILLRLDDTVHDLCLGARASFSPESACWEGQAGAIHSVVEVRVPQNESCKYIDVILENTQNKELEIICAYYLEPVLGVSRMTAQYVRFEQDVGCLLMHNPYNHAVPCHAAVHVPNERPSYTTSRAAFLSGDWAAAELLPNNDPIAGTIVRKRLPARRRERIRFILSAGETAEKAVAQATAPQPQEQAPPREIAISTPSIPLNCFVNTFLPHQILEGRLQGRCAFYQCSGAYGFRDQLQDAGAYRLLDARVTREQILRCCAVQFPEGDVLHWWHALPGLTRGVRTTFSDDLVWLPYTVCEYIQTTGDTALLDEQIPFCEGEQLLPGEHERYIEVRPTAYTESVYTHCIRALERAHRIGERGVPLIGCGDWNDGFSNVGTGGQGQSVWLGMFLGMVLERFAPLCDARADSYHANLFRANAVALRHHIDEQCWDGKWYLRAFYDDGTPIGGQESEECRIDLLSQSFAVFFGMPDKARVSGALDCALKHLVDREYRIIKLFDPPFENTVHNPGYIKAYPPGIRENGGQYTHAAIWMAAALLEAGRANEGWELLDMINPTARCTDAVLAQQFKTEPYYIPADVYGGKQVPGHGGWTIYTGAASWYWRAVLEWLLGLHFSKDKLELRPALPDTWPGFSVIVAEGDAKICITVERGPEKGLLVDGVVAEHIPLDGKNHNVLLTV